MGLKDVMRGFSKTWIKHVPTQIMIDTLHIISQ